MISDTDTEIDTDTPILQQIPCVPLVDVKAMEMDMDVLVEQMAEAQTSCHAAGHRYEDRIITNIQIFERSLQTCR